MEDIMQIINNDLLTPEQNSQIEKEIDMSANQILDEIEKKYDKEEIEEESAVSQVLNDAEKIEEEPPSLNLFLPPLT